MKRSTLFVFVLCGMLLPALVRADQITMKTGQVINGQVLSRADGMVTVNVGGQELKIPEANIDSIQVTLGESSDRAAAPATQATAAAASTPAPSAKPTVPAGTRLVLRMSEGLDSKKHKAGHRFTARLEADLVAEGVVVAPRGSTAYGKLLSAKSSGRVAGSSEMTVAITDIMVNNQIYPVATQPLQAKTGNTARQSTKRTARGAAIGGLVDGKSGAKTGAKVGLGASLLTSGNQINIPAGTLVETAFRTPFSPG